MPAKKVGRPAVPGTQTTFRFPPEHYDLIRSGADIQATYLSRSHPKGHQFSPSNALWLRGLIDYSYKNRKGIPPDVIKKAMLEVTGGGEEMTSVTLILPEEQRVMLRKFECACQALNWKVDLHRNAAINLMVKTHSQAFNEALRLRPSPQHS